MLSVNSMRFHFVHVPIEISIHARARDLHISNRFDFTLYTLHFSGHNMPFTGFEPRLTEQPFFLEITY